MMVCIYYDLVHDIYNEISLDLTAVLYFSIFMILYIITMFKAYVLFQLVLYTICMVYSITDR